VAADLADAAALRRALASESFDAVLHCAAFIEAGESMRDPGKYFANNLARSLDLIEAAQSAGVGRFVLSSTAAVYAPSDELLTEESPIAPANVYGETKRMIELALEWYRQTRGLHYAALRYFNAAGATPGRGEAHRPESHLIPLVLAVAQGAKPHAEIFGTDYPTPDGTCIRDYIHISDLVEAHVRALVALEKSDRLIYNLGVGAGHSVREVIETARQVTGHAISVRETPRRPGDAPRLVASSEKIQSELGWRPHSPDLKDMIASAWDWHRTHPNGYGA
jgi:UDP-glucose 4-epimerase